MFSDRDELRRREMADAIPSTSANVPRQRRYSRSSASNSSVAGSFKPPGRGYYGFAPRRDSSSASKEDGSELEDALAALGGVGSWTAAREDIRDGQSSLPRTAPVDSARFYTPQSRMRSPLLSRFTVLHYAGVRAVGRIEGRSADRCRIPRIDEIFCDAGSARLASLSLITPSPPLVSPPELNLPSTSLSPFVPPTVLPSPSGISRALAPHLTVTAADEDEPESISEETTTPTQSKPGSPPVEPKEIPPKMNYGSQNGSSRNESFTRRRKENEPVALGDELGGDAESSVAISSDDDFDEEDRPANLNGNGHEHESTPLLVSKGSAHAIHLRKKKSVSKRIVEWAGTVGRKTREVKVTPHDVKETAQTAFHSLPAVVLGYVSRFSRLITSR